MQRARGGRCARVLPLIYASNIEIDVFYILVYRRKRFRQRSTIGALRSKRRDEQSVPRRVAADKNPSFFIDFTRF